MTQLQKFLEIVQNIVGPKGELESCIALTPEGFEVEFWEQYDRPQITFDKLEQISKAFGTKLIDLRNGRTEGGCATCDYGSSYGILIKIRIPNIDQLDFLLAN